MGARGPAVAVSLAGLWMFSALLSGAPAAGDELWREAIEAEPCRVELVNELGGVHAEVSELPDQVVLEGDSSVLAIESSRQGGTLTLRVIENGELGHGDVAIFFPRGCSAAVRTDSGAVTVNGGSQGFSYAVETVTGTITAIVDPASDTVLELATSGEITVDYSIAIDREYHAEPAKHGEVIIGTDRGPSTDRVRLTSRRGGISVLRQSWKSNETP